MPKKTKALGSELDDQLGPCACMDPERDLDCGECGRITKPAKIEQERDRYRVALEQIRDGLANMPNPDYSPRVRESIDALYDYARIALQAGA